MEDFVHQRTESSGCVGQAEGHYQPFERSIPCDARRLLLVPFSNSDLVVSFSKVQLSEEFSMSKPVKQISYQRNWVLVLDGYLVKRPIVYSKAQGPIFFLLEQHRCSKCCFGRSDMTGIQKLIQLFPKLFKLRWRHAVS